MKAERLAMVRALWVLGRGALPAILVATLIPLGLFYVAFLAVSLRWGIVVSLAYGYGVAIYQYVRRRRISGMLLVTMFMGTVRAVAALTSGYALVYFAVPVVETAGFGLMFTATMFSSEPLVVRIARDLAPHAADGIAERRALTRSLSLVWTATYLASGATTTALLATVPLRVYLGAHTLTGWFWTGSALMASIALCRRNKIGMFPDRLLAPA
jgi:hypothetical protein